MDAETLWPRYAKIWSSEATLRASELKDCLAENATYCDPSGLLTGRTALSDYMGGFQENVPGGRFEILQVIDHHDRSLARWALLNGEGATLQLGASFATHDAQGRLKAISGFFPLTASETS